MGASLVYLEKPNKEVQMEEGESGKLKFAAGQMQGWRINMEDAHIADLKFTPSSQLFAVFDGHGGKEVALYSQSHYTDILRERLNKQDVEKAMKESFLDIDRELEQNKGKEELAAMKRSNPPNKSSIQKLFGDLLQNPPTNNAISTNEGEQSMDSLMLDSIGCTANVMIIDQLKNQFIVANAGDSRSVLARNGKAVPLSYDHKPENEEERQRIEKAGSVITEGRVDGNLNLSRSLGDLKYKQKKEFTPEEQPITANPDVKIVDINWEEDDFIIMGCDGIWEVKNNQEMVEYVYNKFKSGIKDLKVIIQNLMEDIISEDYQKTCNLLITIF